MRAERADDTKNLITNWISQDISRLNFIPRGQLKVQKEATDA